MIERDGERVIVAKAKYLSKLHPKKPCTAQKDNRQKTEILACHDVPRRHATRAIAKTSAGTSRVHLASAPMAHWQLV